MIVPKKLQNAILQELHQTHLGTVRMKKVARSYVWWTHIDKGIEHLVKNCFHCQVVQNVPIVIPLHTWIWPSESWRRIHADFAGPFCGHTFLIVVQLFQVATNNSNEDYYCNSYHLTVMQIVFGVWSAQAAGLR